MPWLIAAIVLLLLGGLGALACGRRPGLVMWLGATSNVAAAAAGLVAAASVLASGNSESLRLAWNVPYGAFFVRIDALSAFFLLPIFILSSLAAIYSTEYLRAAKGTGAFCRDGAKGASHKRHLSPFGPKSLAALWFFYNLLVASMVLVVVARNAVLFLVAWEVMSLASFFLVALEDEKESVRQAGWTYLVATHLGTALLLALFLILGRDANSLDFDHFGTVGHLAPATANLVFVLALVGFGTKAGFMPLHVWLPEAHPAAPSPVSALMSGAMIKVGIYGLVRTLTLLGPPPMWWGWTLIAIGVTSGVLGVLFALAQHDLKRLLAYHSVENIGIIALGIGVGLLGLAYGSPLVAVLGITGGLLHVINHALFKGLLFLGAGSVFHATHTLDADDLGGLGKRMPWTGITFLIGSVAISGLPPLNGFVSEFLIYLASFHGASALASGGAVPLFVGVAALALIGGLAAACFAKAFGVIFLGEPRSEHAAGAHEAGRAMRVAMLLLAAGCAGVALLAPTVIAAMSAVVRELAQLPVEIVSQHLSTGMGPLSSIVLSALMLLVGAWVLTWLRRRLLAAQPVRETVTWDCGYARPSARMQYTASSFAQSLTDLFRLVLRTRRRFVPPEGLFPQSASLATETRDVFRESIYRPVFTAIQTGCSKLRWLQHGRVQLYVLYIALALVFVLVWGLR